MTKAPWPLKNITASTLVLEFLLTALTSPAPVALTCEVLYILRVGGQSWAWPECAAEAEASSSAAAVAMAPP